MAAAADGRFAWVTWLQDAFSWLSYKETQKVVVLATKIERDAGRDRKAAARLG
jgi:hypothetical protein